MVCRGGGDREQSPSLWCHSAAQPHSPMGYSRDRGYIERRDRRRVAGTVFMISLVAWDI